MFFGSVIVANGFTNGFINGRKRCCTQPGFAVQLVNRFGMKRTQKLPLQVRPLVRRQHWPCTAVVERQGPVAARADRRVSRLRVCYRFCVEGQTSAKSWCLFGQRFRRTSIGPFRCLVFINSVEENGHLFMDSQPIQR